MRANKKSFVIRIFLIIGVALLILLAFYMIITSRNNKTSTNDFQDNIIKENKDENINTNIKDSMTENATENQKEIEKVETKEEVKQDIKKDKEVNNQKEQPKEEVVDDTKVEETKENTPKQEEVKQELNAWDELGITEDEYYNSPAWKWATVDFKIEDYGSEENCLNACIEYGEKSGMGYSCSTINSYSGRYLGEMIKLF